MACQGRISALDADVVCDQSDDNNAITTNVVSIRSPKPASFSMPEILECRMCYNFMYSPIYQCPNGHTLCSDCNVRLLEHDEDRCPTCRCEMRENIRCLALEEMAEAVFQFPCHYKNLGCREILKYGTIANHERHECAYRPYKCPVRHSCPVTGNIPTLVSHFRYYHMVQVCRQRTFDYQIVYSETQRSKIVISGLPMVISYFGQHFVLCVEKFRIERAPVFMLFLQFMGNEEAAQSFRYSLEIQEANVRMLTWQGMPISIRHDRRMVRNSLEGLIVHQAMARSLFVSDKQVIKFRCNVWKGEFDDEEPLPS